MFCRGFCWARRGLRSFPFRVERGGAGDQGSSSMAMASISLSLIPKVQPSSFQNPTSLSRRCIVVVRFFSSSKQEEPDDEITEKPTSPSSSSRTPSLRDLKESLIHQQGGHGERKSSSVVQPFSSPSPSSSSSPRSVRKIDFLEEIGKNLSGFRRRSSPTQPRPAEDTSLPPSSQISSFSEIYNTIAAAKSGATSQDGDNGRPSFDLIRESFRQLRNSAAVKSQQTRRAPDPMSLSGFMGSLNIARDPKAAPFFGSGDLPESVFGKEIAAGRASKAAAASRQTKCLKRYDYGELGEKLMKLRPDDVSGDNWFSLEELKKRLVKLIEMEDIEAELKMRASPIDFLKVSLQGLDEKSKKASVVPRIDVLSQLGQMGGMRNRLLAPPKAHLVDKYFNPDLMNASEKLKVELRKVREDFRLHESDRGSSSVQIAQLTLRIRYLSVVVHKKDKASQRGLVRLVNARKRHMRYLRRTDWDRYCHILSKLGLRDFFPKKA